MLAHVKLIEDFSGVLKIYIYFSGVLNIFAQAT